MKSNSSSPNPLVIEVRQDFERLKKAYEKPDPPPRDELERAFALRHGDELRILASRYAQMGFKHSARFLRKQADAALKWAARKPE